MKKLYTILYILVAALLLVAQSAAAQVSLYLSPSDLALESETYAAGQVIPVRVLVDTGGEILGVAQGTLTFPSQDLEVIGVSRDRSIFSLWVREPKVSGDIITFVGGVPGGFSGQGEAFTVTFQTKTDATAGVLFKDTRVLSFAAQPQDILQSARDGWYPFKIPEAVPPDFLFNTNLVRGNRNFDVAYLQLVLQSEDVYDGGVTGRYDQGTQNAVKAFQEKYPEDILTPLEISLGTGIVEEFTRAKLNKLLPPLIEREGRAPTLFDVLVGPEGARRAVMLPIAIAAILGVLLIVIFLGFPALRRRLRRWRMRR